MPGRAKKNAQKRNAAKKAKAAAKEAKPTTRAPTDTEPITMPANPNLGAGTRNVNASFDELAQDNKALRTINADLRTINADLRKDNRVLMIGLHRLEWRVASLEREGRSFMNHSPSSTPQAGMPQADTSKSAEKDNGSATTRNGEEAAPEESG